MALTDAVLWALTRADFETFTATSVPLLRALNRALVDRLLLNTLLLEERDYGPGVGGRAALRPLPGGGADRGGGHGGRL